MTEAFRELGGRRTLSALSSKPKIMTLGGDHSLALPALRALKEIYGRPIQVLHFDGELGPPQVGASRIGLTVVYCRDVT